MSLFEIKNRFTGSVIFSLECASMKICVEAAFSAGANLRGANLVGAYLRGANLRGANLDGANLVGATYGEGIPLENEPIQLIGTKYFVLIMDMHIKIGCKLFSHAQWENFTDDEISQMDSGALKWWNEWRGMVLSLSLGHQQRIAAKKANK